MGPAEKDMAIDLQGELAWLQANSAKIGQAIDLFEWAEVGIPLLRVALRRAVAAEAELAEWRASAALGIARRVVLRPPGTPPTPPEVKAARHAGYDGMPCPACGGRRTLKLGDGPLWCASCAKEHPPASGLACPSCGGREVTRAGGRCVCQVCRSEWRT